MLALVAMLSLSGCASRVILSENTPGAKVFEGTAVSYEQREKKVGVGTDAIENTAVALTTTTAGQVASLAFAMFNRLSSGPYMEMLFRPDDGSPDERLPFRIGSPVAAEPGDRIRLIKLNDDVTAKNLSRIERWKAEQAAAKK